MMTASVRRDRKVARNERLRPGAAPAADARRTPTPAGVGRSAMHDASSRLRAALAAGIVRAVRRDEHSRHEEPR